MNRCSAWRWPLFAVLTLASHVAYPLSPSQVFTKVGHSIVVVEAFDPQGKFLGQGSGVVLPSGHVATNCHVVEDGFIYTVRQAGEAVPARLDVGDFTRDVCLLWAEKLKARPARIGSAATVRVGAAVFAVGAPKGLELTLSNGIVSQLRDDGQTQFIQTTAAISPGSSGGGLFDSQGRLLGLTTFMWKDGQSLNFAVPAGYIASLKPQSARQRILTRSRNAMAWFKAAISYYLAEDWLGLRGFAQRRVVDDPGDVSGWLMLGSARMALREIPDARQAFERAVRIAPDGAAGWADLGHAYLRLDQFLPAILALSKATAIDPDWAPVWSELATAYEAAGDAEAAVRCNGVAQKLPPRDYSDAQRPRPADGDSSAVREAAKFAELAQKARKAKLKILYFEKATKLDPENPNYGAQLRAAQDLLQIEQE